MTELETITQRAFGPGLLHVTNIGFTVGTRTDLTAEDIARELNKALDEIEAEEFEEV